MNDWVVLPLVILVFVLFGIVMLSAVIGLYVLFQRLGRRIVSRGDAVTLKRP